MTRPRRLLWLLLPAFLVGAALLPRRDPYAAVRGGRRLDESWGTTRGVKWFHSDDDPSSASLHRSPFRYQAPKVYAFGDDYELIERTFLATIRKRGTLNLRFERTYPPIVRTAKQTYPIDVQVYTDGEGGDAVLIYHYNPPEDGVRLLVMVREGRFSWERLGRRVKGWVGR